MDMMAVLRYLYPDADDVTGFVVRGGELVEWNLDAPQPTEAELQAAWIPALKAQKIAEIRRRVVSECETLMPVYEMLYLIRSRTSDPRLSEMDALAKKGRDMETYIKQSNRTEEELEAVDWDTWGI